MKLFDKSELMKRIHRFQSFLQGKGLESALLTLNSDLFYFTGSVQKGMLFIPSHGEPIYFVRKNFERAVLESQIEVRPYNTEIIAELLKSCQNTSLPMDVTTLSEMEFFRKKLFHSSLEIKDCSLFLGMTKMIKSESELEFIKKAAQINEKIMDKIPELYKKGMKDIDMQAEIEYFAKKELGHHGHFWLRGYNMEGGICLVVTGLDALAPTYTDFPIGGTSLSPSIAQGASGAVIEKSFVVDFIGAYHGYTADSTRTFFVGKPDDKIAKIYNELSEIHHKIAAFSKPGMSGEEIWNYTLSQVSEMSWKDYFMGLNQKVSFVAHGIGTEVNQLPVFAPKQNIPLQNLMVIAIEPKVFVPDYGIIGLEDTYIMKDGVLESITGFESLEKSIIK